MHAVRDGRDIAFSVNTRQSHRFFDSLFPINTAANVCMESMPMSLCKDADRLAQLRNIMLWSKVNSQVKNCASNRGFKYRVLRLEDMFSNATAFGPVKVGVGAGNGAGA